MCIENKADKISLEVYTFIFSKFTEVSQSRYTIVEIPDLPKISTFVTWARVEMMDFLSGEVPQETKVDYAHWAKNSKNVKKNIKLSS